MTEIEIEFNEMEIELFIKDLLCLSSNSTWIHSTMESKLSIRFKGNEHNVQKKIFDWLSIPERQHDITLLGD